MSLINNRAKASQLIDFTGLKSGAIHPTDIDAVLEFDGKFLILIEVKTKGNKLTWGQRLVLERIVDAWNDGDKKAIALCVSHDVRDYTKPIMLDVCEVDLFYSGDTWKRGNGKTNVKQTLRGLAKIWNIKKLKGL